MLHIKLFPVSGLFAVTPSDPGTAPSGGPGLARLARGGVGMSCHACPNEAECPRKQTHSQRLKPPDGCSRVKKDQIFTNKLAVKK